METKRLAVIVLPRITKLLFVLAIVSLSGFPKPGLTEPREQDAGDFGSALERANSSLIAGKMLIGKIWLRQAYQKAPNDLARAKVASILRRVSQANPLTVDVKLSFSPSNNVNDGSETSVIWIGDLPFELDSANQKIAGYRAETSVALTYRLSQTAFVRNELLANLYFRNIWIDSGTEEASADLTGSDFNVTNLAVGIRSTMLIFPKFGPAELTGLIGQTWRGGEISSNWLELRAAQTFKIGENALIKSSLGARTNQRLDSEINDSTGLVAAIDWQKALPSGMIYIAGGFYENVSSSSSAIDSRAVGISAGAALPQIFNVRPSAQIRLEERSFDNWSVGALGRTDISLFASLSVDIVALEVYGFSPVVNLGYRKVASTVDIFDREGVTFGVSIGSKF